jgi:anti-anti-sigma factor
MTTATFSTRVDAGTLVLVVTGEIDLANVDEFEVALVELVSQADGHQLVVEAAGLAYLDSTGIKALMRVHEQYGHGRRITLRNPTPAVRRVLDLIVPDVFAVD